MTRLAARRGTGIGCALLFAVSVADVVAREPQAPGASNAGPTTPVASPITTSSNAPQTPPLQMPNQSARFATISFGDLPGWADDDHLAAFKAFLVSCPKVAAMAKSPPKTGRNPIPAALVAACASATALAPKATRIEARAFFERHFQPQRVVHANPQGLLTGYYEPLIDGSRKRDGRFQTPILRRPADLVNVVDETQRAAPVTAFTHMRKTAAGMVPHATRAEIDAGALKGQNLELLYLADPVDVFFLQIQGSGRIRLPDGSVVRVHYDGKNGHPYTSIGRHLIDTGLFAADRMSMGALGRWLRADEARGKRAMHQNASYVFFKELPNDAAAPLGALMTPLSSGRSLAVDPRFHVLGAPVYVSAPSLTHALKGKPYNRLMVAHDVGSAIKGPERGDIYFGSGETAARIAGITKHPGHLFVLQARTPPPVEPQLLGKPVEQKAKP